MNKISPVKPMVVTSGEPAGIGPDLCIALAKTELAQDIVVIGDPDLLASRAGMLGDSIELSEYRPGVERRPGCLQVLPWKLPQAVECGKLNAGNSQSLLDGLARATNGCQAGEFSALITAPLQKSVMIDAGIPFTGHTEFLAEITGTSTPVMLLVADDMRVALASTHMPLRDVANYLTTPRIVTVLEVLHKDLVARFSIDNPRILVCGLNPHAGESGHLGSEDVEVILPAIEHCRAKGMNVEGPLPADTAFTPVAGNADAILAMYHDQGLPVIKYAGFGNAVNVTLGLPVIRTSVDHGTALDLAGTGAADAGSMIAAVTLAAKLASNQ